MKRFSGWVAAAMILAVSLPALWRDERESFRTTWEAVAVGAESVASFGTVTVWDEERETIAAVSAVPLWIAPLLGASPVGWYAFVVGLALLWAGGVRRLVGVFGAGELTGWATAIAATLVLVVVADGHLAALAAAPAPWLLAAYLSASTSASTTACWISLALLSRCVLLLALPLAALGSLLRAIRHKPPALVPLLVGVGAYLVFPEPDWSRFLRFSAGHYFAMGPYAMPAYGLVETLVFPLAGSRAGAWGMLGAFVVWIAAVLGAFRAGERGIAALGVAMALVGLRLGGAFASFLALFVPELRFHPVAEVAGALAGAFLVALGARAAPVLAVGVVAVAFGFVTTRSPAEPSPPAPAPLAAVIAEGDRPVLALPLTVRNDRRWRRALPAEPLVANGLQRLIERNAPVLARELDVRHPDRARGILRRLGIERVVVDARAAPAFGQVLFTSGGESLVELGAPSARAGRCLGGGRWKLASSESNPEVSVPERALDGDLRTRWGTGGPQRPGQFFEIDLGSTEALFELELSLGEYRTDHPRGVRVHLADETGRWRMIASREPWLGEIAWHEGFAYYDGGESGVVRIPLGRNPARRVRIEQTGRTSLYDWSIAELCLRGSSGESE
jgi:hypothetical protein